LNIELLAGETLELAQLVAGHQFNIQERPRSRSSGCSPWRRLQ
jgi:hypothetical protein